MNSIESTIERAVRISHQTAIEKRTGEDRTQFVAELVARICNVLNGDEFDVLDMSHLQGFVSRLAEDKGTTDRPVACVFNQLVEELGNAARPGNGGSLGASKARDFIDALIAVELY